MDADTSSKGRTYSSQKPSAVTTFLCLFVPTYIKEIQVSVLEGKGMRSLRKYT